MQKEQSFSASDDAGLNFSSNLEYSSQNPVYNARQSSSYDQQQKWQHQQQQQQLMFETSNGVSTDMPAVDRTLSFADVMQLADFGPKLALHHPQHEYQQNSHQQNEEATNTDNMNRDNGDNTGVDPVYFLKFPVLSHNSNSTNNCDGGFGILEEIRGREFDFDDEDGQQEGAAGPSAARDNNNNNTACDYNNPLQLEFLGNNASVTNTDDNVVDLSGDKIGGGAVGKSSSSKRKRPRTIKTSEEVESQRMTHIAVERNRRKQMNEHLRVLRSLMPSSYVQRGDQASIIGGAIEFVRELEQLLQCLESQKRRRLYGDQPGPARPMGDSTSPSALGLVPQPPQQPPPLGFPPPLPTGPNHNDQDQLRIVDELDPTNGGTLLQEESAESKSCIADVEVKLLGFDALIKILSRRRPGQLIKAIAALEDLQFTILHTNITTIEQTVLYSFNVTVASEARFTADDIASSVQQIFTFIHANTDII